MRFCAVVALALLACSSRPHPLQVAPQSADGSDCQVGEISYYAASLSGNKTSSGERYDHEGLTAAHRTLPFGTKLRVTVGERSVTLLVNDRGPFAKHRILDVSGRAARELDLLTLGHAQARVCVE